jgi:hypothetical protein
LAPWTLRNFDGFHDVYPIVDSMYLHLWMGNHPKATGGPQDGALLAESLGKTREELARLEQPERYRSLARPMVEELQRDPQAALQRRLWAGLCFFFGEDWLTQRKLWRDIAPADGGNAPDSGPLPLLLLASLLGMLLLGVLGWRLTYGWRHASLPAALAVCWVPLPYILSHGAALSGPRLPLDGVLLCYAAFTLACVLPGTGQALLQGPPPSESDEPR